MKKILFAASEVVPFIKTGGLADVVGSLPKCFDKKNYDVTDLSMMLSYMKGTALLDEYSVNRLDMNEDGSVNVTDLALISCMLKGINSLNEERDKSAAAWELKSAAGASVLGGGCGRLVALKNSTSAAKEKNGGEYVVISTSSDKVVRSFVSDVYLQFVGIKKDGTVIMSGNDPAQGNMLYFYKSGRNDPEKCRTDADYLNIKYDDKNDMLYCVKDNAVYVIGPDGKLKGQKALIDAALKLGYDLNHHNCFFKGQKKTFAYCVEQYGAPLLGKATSKLDAHRINIECFLKYSASVTGKDELKEYYDILRECKFSQHCCKLLKKEPSERKQAELDVDVIVKGLMAAESRSRLTSIATRGHIFESHRPHINGDKNGFFHVNPIALWTDDDVWEYIHLHNCEYSPLYDMTYTAEDGTTQCIKRNGCIMCGTDIQFKDNHLSILRQTHPKAWESCMKHFGYADELYKLFRIKKNKYILDSFTDDGTKARMIERFGSTDRLLRDRPCAYDDMGNLVDLTGTGLENEYDAEVMISPDGQLSMI